MLIDTYMYIPYLISQYGDTPLLTAVEADRCDVVTELLNGGADANAQNVKVMLDLCITNCLYHRCMCVYIM